MIVGIGIDLVRVERVWGLLRRRGPRALTRLFTPEEAARCHAGRHPPESFAARFATKEAFFKALGTGAGRGGARRAGRPPLPHPHRRRRCRVRGAGGMRGRR